MHLIFTTDEFEKGTKRCKIKRFAELLRESRQDLFLHALTGCDSISRPFGIGRPEAIKKTAIELYSEKR